MTLLDFLKLLLLSAIWGGSFLFLRVAAPEFGPIALIWFRVAVASLILCLFACFKKGIWRDIWRHPWKMLFVGVVNAALPWCLLAFAVLTLEAGFTSLLNAATPIFAALIGCSWLRIPLSRWQVIGLIIGVSGVAILTSDQLSFSGGGGNRDTGIAILATLAASLCYGFASQYTKRFMNDLSPWSIAIGNLVGATVVLTPFLWGRIPEQMPGVPALGCAVALAVFSTALAFVLLFDILSRSGATATSTVTFIIPIFGILFGAVFLKEEVTTRIITGMIVALTGAALTTKLLPLRKRALDVVRE